VVLFKNELGKLIMKNIEETSNINKIDRVALVACGGLREFSNCYKSWNLFENQHNYVFTWDTDYLTAPYTQATQYPIKTKIHDLIDAKNSNYIKDYEVFIESEELKGDFRKKNLFLWSQLDSYLSYDYDYVLITRPDVKFLKSMYDNIIYSPPKENEVHVYHVNDANKFVSDCEFFMTRSTYKIFSEIYNFSIEYTIGERCTHTHLILYEFLKEKQLKVMEKFPDLATSLIFRPSAKHIEHATELDLRNAIEMGFIIQDKHATSVLVESAVLIVSDKFLSGEVRRTLVENLDQVNKLSKYVFFESNSESVGMEKIRRFQEHYNVSFSNIITINSKNL